MSTALYCLADLHLAGFPWSRREEFYGDAFRALESAEQVIINDEPGCNHKAVVLSGDITDQKAIEDDTAYALNKFVTSLRAAGIQVYYVNGNHDMSKRGQLGHVGVFGGIHIHEKTTQIHDFNVYGLDWLPRTVLKQKLTTVPECDILFLHCAFEHLLSFQGAFDLSKDDVPEHIPNVFVGDVHVTNITQNCHGTDIVSPGPLHPCSIAQHGPHGMMRIKSDEMEWYFLEIDTRHVLDIKIEGSDIPAADIANNIKTAAATKKLKPHCVIRYSSDESDLADQVMSLVKDVVHIHDKKSNTGHMMTPQQRAEMLSSKEETSLEKEVEAFEAEDPATAAFVKDLLLSTDPEKLLAEEYNTCVLPSEQIPC
jgi:DNA repair exonuclease SbcCD nuclease subunit